MSKREDRIREAASLQVKIGQLQRYCELMVELGEVNIRALTTNLNGPLGGLVILNNWIGFLQKFSSKTHQCRAYYMDFDLVVQSR